MLLFFQELFLPHLPQSSRPHWRGFWFCFQSLQENDNCFSRKPHLVESRFPQWWNDAGSYRSAGLVLCQEREVLSLYLGSQALSLLYAQALQRNASRIHPFHHFMSFDAQMEPWTLIPQGVSWSLLGLGSFFMIWWNESAAGSTDVNACGLEICVKLMRFSVFSILLHRNNLVSSFILVTSEGAQGCAHPMPLDSSWRCPCLPQGIVVTDNSVSPTEKVSKFQITLCKF